MKNYGHYYSDCSGIQFSKFIADKTGCFPSSVFIQEADPDKLTSFIKQKNWKVISQMDWFHEKETVKTYYQINENMFALVESSLDGNKRLRLMVYFPERLREKVMELIDFEFFIPKDQRKFIHLLSFEYDELSFVPFELKVSDLNIHKFYNDGFVNFHDKLLHLINKNERGIVLLHGNIGTGKTSYLKHLGQQTNRKFLFIPPSLAHWIGTPKFNSMMSAHKNAVLLLEDAEDVLGANSGVRKAETGNLLNLTDGILSECFNLLIICTFNANIKTIDQALLRPGRLRAQYEFKELAKEKVQQITNETETTSKTLADIFAEDQMIGTTKTKIGFV